MLLVYCCLGSQNTYNFYVYMCGTVTCRDRCRLTISTGPVVSISSPDANQPITHTGVRCTCPVSQSRNYVGLRHGHRPPASNVLFSSIVCQGITHLYMQLHGVYGILATPIYGSDRSGTIYGRVPSFLNISNQLRFEDIVHQNFIFP